MRRQRQRFGFHEVPGTDAQHRLDGGHDVPHGEDVELLGPQPEIRERAFALGATEEQQVHGAPAHAHEHEGPRLERPRDRQQFVRDRDPVVRVLRREHRVVQQRQSFGERDGIAGISGFVDDRLQLGELPRAVVRRFGREPGAEPALQIRSRAAEAGERVTHEREERGALVGDAQLVQPQPARADRRLGAHHGETFVVGRLRRTEELFARRAQTTTRQHRLGAAQQRRRGLDGLPIPLGCGSRSPAFPACPTRYGRACPTVRCRVPFLGTRTRSRVTRLEKRPLVPRTHARKAWQ